MKAGIETGITIGRLIPGMVPELEERNAAADFGVPWPAYQAMDRYEQVDLVAAFRLRRYIEQHGHEATSSHMEQQRAMAAAKAAQGR